MQLLTRCSIHIKLSAFLLLILPVFGSAVYAQNGDVAPPDTVMADTLRPPGFDQAFRTIRGERVAMPQRKQLPRLYYITLPAERVIVERDSEGRYRTRKMIGDVEVAAPSIISFQDYARMQRESALRQNWGTLIQESARRVDRQRGLLDFSLTIPGGRQSAFTTIFGKPEVNLRVNGLANMNVGASVQKTNDPALPPDQQTRVDPTFDQNLQLNIQGTIGDKLTIQTDWDTERIFDYQNRLSIVYQGYDDEIIKRVEMGNVSIQTGNSLIRGSGALFGIKSVAELGPLRFTTIVSQQKGESGSETISGGSQEQVIQIRPAEYEDDRHFFLDFYSRDLFEQSMANPQQMLQIFQISEMNVWVLKENIQADEGSRLAVALVDYGVVENPDGTFSSPNNEQDPFDASLIDSFRDPTIGISATDLGIDDPRDFEQGYFTLLREGEDYTINNGYISLRRTLGSREVLAVSFSYINQSGVSVNVGDVNQGGTERIFLKMLRPKNVATDNKAFPLTMRNIYSIGASNITRDNLELDIQFTEGNVAQNRLPGRNSTLLQDLGLDRVDSQGGLAPDNQVDFGTGTLDPVNGRIIFPYLEPFGERMGELLDDSGASQEDLQRLVFTELYSERQQNAARIAKNNFYRISGTSRGGLQDNYTLGFALVEGSVRVTANGVQLTEGVDFQVDYSFGSITILNDRYTAAGQEIRIEYENQAFTSIEQKTFTGLRAEYEINNDIRFGATYFRYNERPLDDKIRIGDEPISNSVLGLDANARFDTPFITRALDAVPLIQTRDNSFVTFSGEFAQLRPGVAETRAVSRAIRNNELFSDEEDGLSFIDDFEGSNVKISLLNATRWFLAAAPAAVPGYDSDELIFEDGFTGQPVANLQSRIDRSDLRSKFSWYTIPRNISSILGNVQFTPESLPVRVTDVFPGRETNNPQEEIINTLDIFYNPTERGPYNYNMDLRNLLENEPEKTWGGMTSILPSGQEDFSQNNIEFLEFWVQPLLPDGREPTATDIADYDGKIYIDIGIISEDVIPNNRLNTEDGLAINTDNLILDRPMDPRSALQANPVPPEGQFSNVNRDLEDVGLDGLPSFGGIPGFNEQTVFADFIEEMRQQFGESSEEFQRIQADPSNDTYVYYGESAVRDLKLHERFHRMLGYTEGNSPLTQGEKRAVTNRPDTEGLVNPSIVELNNSYFQYEIPFNPADQASLDNPNTDSFIIDRVPGSRQDNRWYQVRIPLQEFKRIVGDINDFQNISYIRIWMSGYSQPFTLRFATLEFVGSQWQKEESINQQSDPNAEIRVSSINIEENSNRRPFPYRQPFGGIRAQNRGTQIQSLANEQSLVMEVDNLAGQSLQMIKRVYPGGLNLINYSNMRMFIHGEGYDNRGDAELVMRFGNDLENNYYEYRQPVTPSDDAFPFENYDPGAGGRMDQEAEQVWLYDENSMNIVLSAFNQLKQLRDQDMAADPSGVYERGDILTNAVPGAVIAVKGNPSLTRITEIGMGIRNPFDPLNPSGNGVPLLNAQFWVNELRVSGFDNEKGWAANAKTTFKLADFATVNGNLTRQTEGFGSLDSKLGQRRVSDQIAYDINSTVNIHKFIPERYGWNIPVTLSTRRSTSTPKFLPNQGDVRLTDFEDAVRARNDISEDEKDRLIRQGIRDVQTYSENYSINFSNISKRNSQSRLMQYTLDNVSLNYVYNTGNSRNPQYRFQDNWNFTTSVRYNLTFRNVRFARPLFFLDEVPILNAISDFQLGYMPNNITTSFSTSRTYEERKRRVLTGENEFPLQQTHNFNYNTTFGFGYNFTRSITTSFQTRSAFDLGRFAIEDAGLGGIDSEAFRPIPTFKVVESLVTDTLRARRANYQEDYTASWTPRLNQLRGLNWLTYSARYGGGYRWENSPFGSDLGARVSNTFRLDHTARMDVANLLNRISFYKDASDANRLAIREREQRRQRIRREREKEPEDRQAVDPIPLDEQALYFGRKLLLGIFSMSSMDITYNNSKTSSQAGYAGGSRIYDMFGSDDNFSPPFSYRIGITEQIGRSQLIDNIGGVSTIQLPANNTYSDNITLGTQLNPTQTFSIDLNWNTQWDERLTENISVDPFNEFTSVRNSSGNISSTVWAFGSGYRELFERQLQTAFDDISPNSNTISDDVGNNDGRTVLNRNTLQEDFRRSYLSSADNSFGDRNFTPFPLPNWRVNWTGIEKWIPFIGQHMQTARISHAYTGRYRLGWSLNNNPGPLAPRRIGAYTVSDERAEFEPTSVNIEQRFAPMVQLNVTWQNNLRTQIGYEYSKLTSLALSNSQITERESRGIRMSMAYTIRNFRLPFMKTLNNNVDITLNGNYIEDSEQRYLLDADIERALQDSHDAIIKDPSIYSISPRPPTGQTRFNASAIVGYRFSNTVQANFEYAYGKVLPKSSRTFERTTHDIRFNIRINIRSS